MPGAWAARHGVRLEHGYCFAFLSETAMLKLSLAPISALRPPHVRPFHASVVCQHLVGPSDPVSHLRPVIYDDAPPPPKKRECRALRVRFAADCVVGSVSSGSRRPVPVVELPTRASSRRGASSSLATSPMFAPPPVSVWSLCSLHVADRCRRSHSHRRRPSGKVLPTPCAVSWRRSGTACRHSFTTPSSS